MAQNSDAATLKIGWAQADITPQEPVAITGQFHARVSEGVRDPITATALVLDSADERVIFVSCDLVAIGEALRDAVVERLPEDGPGAAALIMNATHTHTAAETRLERFAGLSRDYGVDLEVMAAAEYVQFAARRIADAIEDAWDDRSLGSVAFGLGQAVVGRNRRWVDVDGKSTMYGNTDTAEFSHIEGYEDHSVNILATYDMDGELTGVIVNVPCPSQETESLFVISADFWHETRQELRKRLGGDLYVLPQASAAGDQSPHLIWGQQEHERMLKLKGRTSREEIAHRIAEAVEDTLSVLPGTQETSPLLAYEHRTLELPLRKLSEEDVQVAEEEAAEWREKYQQELQRLEDDPSIKQQPRWYTDVTRYYRKIRWCERVSERFEKQQQQDPTREVTLHLVRLGEVAFATNPFEYYLDFGIYIKARSPAIQTFVVQLAGSGTYVPSARSISGGGYGSRPASTPIGPDGGRTVADTTIDALEQIWSCD